jgi:hypothetical protein
MEQLVIVLLIALISIVNWIVQKSKERRVARKLEQQADRTGEGVKGGVAEAPEPESEVAMRRLREALGLPEEAPPPTLPRRIEERVPPLPPVMPQRKPPPLPERAPKPVVLHVPPTRPREERRISGLHHWVGRSAVPKVEAARPTSRIRELLGSTGGLRDAVVLSEILGPPKSMREKKPAE